MNKIIIFLLCCSIGCASNAFDKPEGVATTAKKTASTTEASSSVASQAIQNKKAVCKPMSIKFRYHAHPMDDEQSYTIEGINPCETTLGQLKKKIEQQHSIPIKEMDYAYKGIDGWAVRMIPDDLDDDKTLLKNLHLKETGKPNKHGDNHLIFFGYNR